MANRAAHRRLKVVSVSHSAVNRTSGRIRYEALAARRDDIDLTLVAPARWREYGRLMPLDPHEGELDFRVEPIRLPYVPGAGWYLHYYPGLAGLLQRLRPDVIHLWEEPWSLVAWQAARLRNRLCPGAAYLLETDQNILRRLPPPFEQIRRSTLGQVDLLIGRGPESLEVARACGYAGPTAIVEYGVAPGVFGRQDRAACRDALGVSGFVIGYVGRLVVEKGLHDVLEAMAACQAPITLLVVGGGADEAGLRAHAGRLGLGVDEGEGGGGRVRFLPPRPPAGIAGVMNALDALVLMSRTTRTWKEQFGRVIMEAQACGTPVIGSTSGAIPGVVAGGGWIVPEGDVPALSALLDRLAASPGEVAERGRAGFDQAGSRFSTAQVADCLADAYVRAAEARGA